MERRKKNLGEACRPRWTGLLAALALILAEAAHAQPTSSHYRQSLQKRLQLDHHQQLLSQLSAPQRTHTSANMGEHYQPPNPFVSASIESASGDSDDKIFRRKHAFMAPSSEEAETVDFSPLQESLEGQRNGGSSSSSSSGFIPEIGQQDPALFDLTALGESTSGSPQNQAASAYELEGSSLTGGSQASAVTPLASELADETPETISHESPYNQDAAIKRHNSQLQTMQEMFERRQLAHQRQTESSNQNKGLAQGHNNNQNQDQNAAQPELESSQELAPISIGLDPTGPFSMSPFSMGGHADGPLPVPPGGPRGSMVNADEPSLGLSFGLNQLPHLLGFQSPPSAFGDGPPQRGDPMPGNLHQGSSPAASGDPDSAPQTGPNGQKVYPKIFRFTDGRINLSDSEKQKKIRLSNKNQLGGGAENHIESAPIMFDGRQLKRKSFLILHGGIFSRR